METNTINPLPGIPRVRVLDEEGNQIMSGYYMHHINRCLSPIGDSLKEKDVDHIVLSDSFADWNMPQSVRLVKVTPPHTIEIIKDDK